MGDLGEIKTVIQLIPGSEKSDKPFNIIGVDKVHLKSDCINGSIVNGTREFLSYSFALDKPSRHKRNKGARMKLFKKIKNSLLSHIKIYLEDEHHKPVDFNGKTISFTYQLVKI